MAYCKGRLNIFIPDKPVLHNEGSGVVTLILQVLFLNLIISFENVGIFALATAGMPANTATKVHRIGIAISLACTLILVAVTGVLFAIPWLHIRIVGGVLLLYITFNMLLQHRQTSDRKSKSNGKEKDSFFEAIISISVAIISMSLDHSIAMSSIISIGGHALDIQRVMIVLGGLFFGALILLLFSGSMIKSIERFTILNYLCAGYFAYIAIRMISEDETIKLFFECINFTFTIPGAALCGILIAFYGLFDSGIVPGGDTKKRSTNLPIYCVIVVYALATIGAMSYLDTNPIIEGISVSVKSVYGFIPSGINAIYTIGSSSELITICAAILVGATARDDSKKSYISSLLSNVKGTVTYILLGLFVNSVGLTFIFGLGELDLLKYLTVFLMQTLLLLSYTAAFTMISTFIKGKAMIVVLGLLYIMLEPIEAAAFIYSDRFPAVAYFFPSYHFAAIVGHITSPYSVPMTMLISVLYISLFAYIGYCRYQSQHGCSITNRK